MRSRTLLFAPFVLAALCGCGGSDHAANPPTRYAVTRLAADAQTVKLYSLNDTGQYVGNTQQFPLPDDAVVVDGAAAKPLEPQRQILTSAAYALNNRGQAAGTREVGADIDGGFTGQKACIYSNGVTQTIDAGSAGYSYAYALNDAGQVAGTTDVPGSNTDGIYRTSAFFWQNGNLTSLGTLGGPNSYGADISQSGQVVGSSYISDNVIHAFLWQNGKMTDLSGGAANANINSEARAINSRGQVVGMVDGHAALWQNGTVVNLGRLPGDSRCVATSINDAGDILGESSYEGSGPIVGSGPVSNAANRSRASRTVVLPTTPVVLRNGSAINLNDLLPANSGWRIDRAFKINNRRQILARGTYQGNVAYILLTPQ